MVIRRILAAAGLAVCFALVASSAMATGVKIGGEDRKKGCRGIFCVRADKVIDKLAPVVVPPPQTSKPNPAPDPQALPVPTQVCVYKFKDANGNGIRDWNEGPLASWSFTITGPIGAVSMLPTGPGGGSCFTTTFLPGLYQISETTQPGWLATTAGGPIQSFTIVPGNNVVITFGNRYLGLQQSTAVCVTKYNDLNGNGVRDSGEAALSGWLFTVKNASGAIVDFGTTNTQGVFCTTHPLAAGTATVSELLQSGWVSTDPGGTIPTKSITVVTGQTTNVAFGNRIPPPPQPVGQICVVKYDDRDGNGANGPGEPLLSGWQFTITGPSGPLTLTSTAGGPACTPVSLTLGAYVVTEVMLAGWSSTSPGGATPHRNVTVVTGPSNGYLTFGNVHAAPHQICVMKYRDLDKDHTWDVGEPVLSGWAFTIQNASGNVVASGVTGNDGRYCSYTNLPFGNYTAIETQQAGWVSTDPGGPPVNFPPWQKQVTLTATQGAAAYFGNIKSGTLCVFKYNDVNGNGQRDPIEPPISGWTFRTHYSWWNIFLGPVLTTDAAGKSCIDLPPGNNMFQVAEQLPSGWTSTDPVPLNSTWAKKIFSIVEGQTTNVSFGNKQTNPSPGPVCIVKYNDRNHNGVRDAGEWLVPGFHFTIKTASGTTVATIVTTLSGPVCQDLPVGSYTAVETTQPGWQSTDPGGATPQKSFVIGNGQPVNLAFGNYQYALP